MELGNLAATAAMRVGERLADRWQLERLDSVDLIAAAYTAQAGSNRQVTVRVLHDRLVGADSVASQFVAVARKAGSIPHADAVPFVDEGRLPNGAPFVVTEHAAGETLAELVARRRGRIPPTEGLRVVVELLSCLEAAHAQGFVHGAVQPDHVLLADNGAVRLVGFGTRPLRLAAMQHLGLGPSLEMASFTPPELARNPDGRATGSCDVWGAAALLLYLLAGETIHAAPTAEEQLAALASRPPRVLHDLAPFAPAALERAVGRGLALSPRERFASARSMRSALEQLMVLPEVITLRDLRSVPGRTPSTSSMHPASHHPAGAGPSSARDGRNFADTQRVIVAPGKIVKGDSRPIARAITLPALPRVDAGPDSSPWSSRDGSLARYLGRAWAATSVGENTTTWRMRLVEITHARMALGVGPLVVDVLPWGLREGEADSWEADLGLLPLVHRLYAGGLRSLVVDEPLEPADANALIELPFVLGETEPGNDDRCTLWRAQRGRIRFVLDDEIETLGRPPWLADEWREVVALTRFDTTFQLEDCWQSAARRRPKEAPGTWRAGHQEALHALSAVGLSHQGLRDDLRARLTARLEAELELDPKRVESFRDAARRERIDRFTASTPLRPERHDARVAVIAALCRLVELAGTNVPAQTVNAAIEALEAALSRAWEVSGRTLDVGLTDKVITVSGEPLRAGRAAYAAADGMAQVLVEHGIRGLQFSADVDHDAIVKLHEACTQSVRGVGDRGLTTLHVRGIEIALLDAAQGKPSRRMASGGGLEGYAGALVALRRFYAGVEQMAPSELRWVRHVAHRLVDEVLTSETTTRSVLALAPTHRDRAARAVHTALLALVATKQLTTSRELLSHVALAGLLRHVAERDGHASYRNLSQRLGALCLAMGGCCHQALPGVVAAFGVAWLDHQSEGGPLGDREPMLISRIVHQAGQVVDSLSHPDLRRTPAEALRASLARPNVDQECLCLLVGAVGALPVGTVVELDNRAWAVVIEPDVDLDRLDQPTVCTLTTAAGRAIERPARTELSRATSGGSRPQRAVRLVPAGYTRFNVARALLSAC